MIYTNITHLACKDAPPGNISGMCVLCGTMTELFDPEFDKLGASNIDGVLSWRYRYHVD